MQTLQCPKCDGPVIRFPKERRFLCERCHAVRDMKSKNVRYRAMHKERLLKADRARYAKTREAKLASVKAYYEANKEEILRKKKAREQGRKKKPQEARQ